jgi:hypothetical protein
MDFSFNCNFKTKLAILNNIYTIDKLIEFHKKKINELTPLPLCNSNSNSELKTELKTELKLETELESKSDFFIIKEVDKI